MTQYLILRHGQSQADLENRFEGRADFPLTALGRAQAHAVVEWMALYWQPKQIWSSPLQRTLATAQVVAHAFGLEVQTDPDLQEWHKGVLDGMLREEANRLYPPPQHPRGPDDPIQDGESARQVYQRAARFWERLQEIVTPDDYVLIVSHGGLINMLYRVFLGLPVEREDIGFSTGDTGMHLWEVRDGRHIVRFSNFTAHLPRDLRT
ncbi:MAG: histidine phosphatase family protein [Anaerolineae bacterium]|nr:MAG: histidine phosphatase family protein [Anaerolineae bacterium]